MRGKVYSALLCGTTLGLIAFWLLGRQDALQSSLLSLRAQSFDEASEAEYRELARLAKERALLYETLLEAQNLSSGLVVGRDLRSGAPTSVCDSLLFSSLRFVALEKLGEHEKAAEAFAEIDRHNYWKGRFIRHPDCRRKSSSRDMIVGLMAALTLEPSEHNETFAKLMGIISRTGGLVDDGPFYVSRLTPGLLELLKLMAIVRDYPVEAWPPSLRLGFSTVEFDSWVAAPGFRAHLNAMTLWVELEILKKHPDAELQMRSLSAVLDQFSPSWGLGFQMQRRHFAANSLYELDADNLFFDYLRLRTAGALSYRERSRLLRTLLSQKAFPEDRLPRDCDRAADYMWQRHSVEYKPKKVCHEQFAGVDFLFLAGLLIAEDET